MKPYYEIIRDLREDHDLRQSQIAQLLKTTQQVYSRYEKGQNEIPLRHLITLAKFYNVSLDYIAGLITEKKPLEQNGQPESGRPFFFFCPIERGKTDGWKCSRPLFNKAGGVHAGYCKNRQSKNRTPSRHMLYHVNWRMYFFRCLGSSLATIL